jgi:hypothetical protein
MTRISQPNRIGEDWLMAVLAHHDHVSSLLAANARAMPEDAEELCELLDFDKTVRDDLEATRCLIDALTPAIERAQEVSQSLISDAIAASVNAIASRYPDSQLLPALRAGDPSLISMGCL